MVAFIYVSMITCPLSIIIHVNSSLCYTLVATLLSRGLWWSHLQHRDFLFSINIIVSKNMCMCVMGVQKPMKMTDSSFLKTKLNRTDVRIQKLKTQFLQFSFQKPTSGVWRLFFTLSHSSSFQHDRISSQRLIFLQAISLHF